MRRERTARRRTAGLGAALLAAAGWLTVACGPGPGTFHPARATAAAAPGQASGTASQEPGTAGQAPGTADQEPGTAGQAPGTAGRGTGRDLLIWPPFGTDVHIVMPGGRPRVRREIPAIIVAQDFLLAYLYAEYRGNQDDRWASYVSGPARNALESNLAAPDVTTESFTGTITFSRLSAFPDPTEPGAVDVSECFDNARSANTSLATGKIVPDHGPASRHYYLNTDVLAVRNGHWRVISVDPVIYYPQARECKP